VRFLCRRSHAPCLLKLRSRSGCQQSSRGQGGVA
jgi:hypothetical protein